MDNNNYQSLISEAIKRILLDMVVRGHGDRLIGRWSREPEIQKFLERVPYMLDRINQLHLACTRVEEQSSSTHHYHHHHHHHHHLDALSLNRSSLNDFVNLIGDDHHWLVRTRDSLGLTPLHKAVLFNNRPIVEYILDRYPDELASYGWRQQSQQPARASQPVARLIDAQDKYGRTALHYAAALLNPSREEHKSKSSANHIYHFLAAKGASLIITDFRGKSAPYYVRHPKQLRAKSVIHLANKLNANYQANVLSKTLRVSSRKVLIAEKDSEILTQVQLDQLASGDNFMQPQSIRESMSVSCNDLRESESPVLQERTKSDLEDNSAAEDREWLVEKVTIAIENNEQLGQHDDGERQENQLTNDDESSPSLSSSADIKPDSEVKRLIADRCQRQIIDQRTKALIRRSLNEGIVDKINEKMAEGYGQYIVSEATVSCWNQHCKRYIANVIPSLLEKLDALHELIAANRLTGVKSMLNKDPILVRIRRPYKRAALSALHLAVQLDRRSIVQHLINQFPESIGWPDSQGATCLHWAARCLKRDKLYRWLLEHYGTRLEQVRDSRGKSAADYRQQAIRMLSFVQSQGSSSRDQQSIKSARDIMQQSQAASNRLQLRGTKMQLADRFKKSNVASSKAALTSSNSNYGDSQNDDFQLIDSVEIGINSASSTTKDDVLQNLDTSENTRGSPDLVILKDNEKTKTRKASSAVCFTQGSSPDEKDIVLQRRLSDTIRSKHRELNLMSLQPISSLSSKVGTKGEEVNPLPSQNFLDEMAQLECETLTERKVKLDERDDCDSPLATTALPLSRPQSASTGGRLDSIIVEAIRTNDFKKLEHIVLAGCGQRLQRVVFLTSSSGDQLANILEEEMSKFLKVQVPRYMEIISQIHETLHQCYSNSSDTSYDPNRLFHKLCNLLSRNRLILSRDRHGASPLHIALIRSDQRLADYLIHRHPEAASAPDLDFRNVLHYAAITLAVREAHGSFKLIHRLTDREEERFWLVNETCKLLYENLCCRYTDLLSAKDGFGLACADYLIKSVECEHIQFDNQPAGVLSSEAISGCCPEYAKLLNRYDYRILLEARKDETKRNKNSVRKKLAKRAESYEVSQEIKPSRALAGRRRTADDLLGSTENIAPLAELMSGELTVVKQVAPKPTVGSSTGFPSVTSSVSNCIDHNSPSTSNKKVSQKQSMHLNNRGHKTRALLDGLDPNHRGHSHHRHHGKRSHSSLSNSIVGGVIVPTIIHNDKMDEIETYDIIYRQPPSRASSSSSSDEDDKGLELSKKEATSGRLVGGIAKGRKSRASDSYSDSDFNYEDGDDDEQVERLSDEFEDRVRSEKSELKAKVDQIMNEIKLSAKSSKSAHFLTSPIDSRREPTAIALDQDPARSTLKLTSSNDKADQASVLSMSLSGRSPDSSLASKSLSCSLGGSSGSFSSCSSASSSSSSTSAPALDTASKPLTIASMHEEHKIERAGANQAANILFSDLPGRQVVSKNTYGQTYLHFIGSRSQSSSILYKVLDHGSHLIGERDIFYRTARDVAVQFNLPNNVQIFDKYIIDLFVGANTGLLRHLLVQGYSPLIHVADPDGNDIMLILKLLRLDRMIHFLLQMADFQRWRDELHTFIRHGYSAGVSELIRKHKDLVRAKSGHSRTSLHLAVLFDRTQMVEELLEVDPECVHLTDNMGRTALHYFYGAHLKNSDQIRAKLIDCGCRSDLRDVKMRTPKYYYIFKREIEDIKRMELELD